MNSSSARGVAPRRKPSWSRRAISVGVSPIPWGQKLFFTCLETGDDLIVTVRSAGPDRVFWTSDDVVSD